MKNLEFLTCKRHWRAPKLLNGLKCESKLKTMEEQKIRHVFWLVAL